MVGLSCPETPADESGVVMERPRLLGFLLGPLGGGTIKAGVGGAEDASPAVLLERDTFES